ncbi:MAG: conjugal transfer protein TraR [Dehalococcoidia bacterium]|nr:conjugal transfer protein TraR [Dehalococcoidia bacterium]
MAPRIKPAESLDKRKAELTTLVTRLRGDDASDAPAVSRGDFEGLVSAAQEATERGTRVELRHLVEQRLVELDDARRRLEQGRYGVCQLCSEEIPAKRLKAVPQATHCIDCQRKLEDRFARARAA